jgi:hypothetical protein
MQNREQVEAQLRNQTRDQIFNRQLAEVLDKKETQRAATEHQTFSEKTDWTKYTV